MHKPLFGLLVAVFATMTTFVRPAEATGFHFLQQPGPFDVGLRVVPQYDNSRSFGNGVRPLQTLVWYPAVRGAAGERMHYRDTWPWPPPTPAWETSANWSVQAPGSSQGSMARSPI